MQSTGKVIDFNRIHHTNSNTTQRKKPKILFVDDEERILNTMQALFRRQYDTTTTTDGYHALELLKQDHYQLLVSDQRMPIMAGVDLLRSERGPLVMEVNSSPGLKGIEESTGINVAKKIIQFVEEFAQPGKAHGRSKG